jgi:signal transduction histidine kinase
MDSPEALHDSGLRDAGLLSRLLHAGILMLDGAHRCRYASAVACELLGAPDEAALRTGWDDIRVQLPLEEMAGITENDLPLLGRVDVQTAAGPRLLRVEVHAIPGEGHLMLIRDRARLDDADRVLLSASEAHANRHALAGLVHEAKGPLNNFHLTLALLASALARTGGPAHADATRARWPRYLDVLQTETARLTRCLDDIGALAQPGDPGRVPVDLHAMTHDVMRLLRPEATIRDARIELDGHPSPVHVRGHPRQLQLALLGFTTTLLEATPPGGVISLRVHPAHANVGPRIHVEASPAAIPPALETELFRIGSAADSRYPAAIAGRMIIEAHGGDVSIQCESTTTRSRIAIVFCASPVDDPIVA